MNVSNLRGKSSTVKVTVNGAEVKVTNAIVKSGTVKFIAPALSAGTYAVIITNDDGTVSSAANLTYNAKPTEPAPVINSITQNNLKANVSSAVTMNVSNLRGNSSTVKVIVNGAQVRVTNAIAKSGRVKFIAPALPAGTYDVTIINADGTQTTRTNALTVK